MEGDGADVVLVAGEGKQELFLLKIEYSHLVVITTGGEEGLCGMEDTATNGA